MAKPSTIEVQDQISSADARAVFNAEALSKLNKAHDTIEHPDKFADVFCNAAETQSKVKDVIKKQIEVSTATDPAVRKSLKEIVKEVEKEEMWIWGKKIGFAAWTVLILVMGALLNKWIK